MPTQVKVAASDALDGEERILADKLGNDDAKDLARNVHANTGEIVTLTPYLYDEKVGDYVLDAAATQTHGSKPVEKTDWTEESLGALSGGELNALAATHEVADWKKSAKKDDKVAALLAHQAGPAETEE